jgi:hypothetical protein
MSNTAILEEILVEDTLFGEKKVVDVVADSGPDSGCFCICGCTDSTTKTNSRLNVAADSYAMSPIP